MAVIEGALGKTAICVDVPVALIGSPVAAIPDVTYNEYGKPRNQNYGKQEAHYSSAFYFLHLLSPPNRSSSVTA